jgi:hypothetical protein
MAEVFSELIEIAINKKELFSSVLHQGNCVEDDDGVLFKTVDSVKQSIN